MKKYAVYTGTKNLYHDMEVAAKSLIANSNVDLVYFLIEDDVFPAELPEGIIQCRNMSNQQFFKSTSPNMKNQFSYMAMLRIALAYIFEDISIILSLDCDTIVMKDISGLWNTSLDEYYFSATPEHDRSKYDLVYCNHGVVLYNLDRMRRGKAQECIDILNISPHRYVDQDVGNFLCQGRIHKMPSTYNMNRFTDKNPDTLNAHIIHYAGMKQNEWYSKPEVIFWRNLDWDTVMSMHTEKVIQYS